MSPHHPSHPGCVKCGEDAKRLVFVNEVPTEPGLYWWRGGPYRDWRIAEVIKAPCGLEASFIWGSGASCTATLADWCSRVGHCFEMIKIERPAE